jgi:hypothetical protein
MGVAASRIQIVPEWPPDAHYFSAVEHLSYLTQVIEIWILGYPVQAVSNSRKIIYSSVKAESVLKGALSEGGGGGNKGETFYPSGVSPQELRCVTQ